MLTSEEPNLLELSKARTKTMVPISILLVRLKLGDESSSFLEYLSHNNSVSGVCNLTYVR